MAKIIKYGDEARRSLLTGVGVLAKTVAVTMGPAGKTVIIGKPVGAPIATKDGVSVAREITLEDPIEELGCQLVKEVAGRSAQVVGDGTTTSTVLAYEIFKSAIDLTSSGYLPLYFKNGIEVAKNLMIKELKSHSNQITSDQEIIDVSTISANNDPVLGKLIADASIAVGKDGLILGEPAPNSESYFRLIDGLELATGYTSSIFVPPDEKHVMMSNALIAIIDAEIKDIPAQDSNFIKLLSAITGKRSLLVFCRDLKGAAANYFASLFKNKQLNVCFVKIPAYKRAREEWIKDLGALTGATPVDGGFGLSYHDLTAEYIGGAERVTVDSLKTNIINPKKNTALVSERLTRYHESIKHLIGESEALDIKERIGFLSNKIAIVYVGYSTELELREKGDRFDDACFAVKAAQQEGYLVGGGLALYRSAIKLESEINSLSENFRPAAAAFYRACKEPAKQIIKNSGLDPEKILSNLTEEFSFGYNTATGEFGNLIKMGIIDPTKVTTTAVENATSIATILITTESVVAEDPGNPSAFQPQAGYRIPSQKFDHKY